ncbi:MAG TPA: hypothetical protein DIW07_04625 [Lachnospiraceae bacterium]|jgi:hypothetical protein|nr:hypothetical protein [Lachnospiraceae bacterium]
MYKKIKNRLENSIIHPKYEIKFHHYKNELTKLFRVIISIYNVTRSVMIWKEGMYGNQALCSGR